MTNNQQQAIEESLIASVELEELREEINRQRKIISTADMRLLTLTKRFEQLNEVINKNLNLVLMKENI